MEDSELKQIDEGILKVTIDLETLDPQEHKEISSPVKTHHRNKSNVS